MKILYVQSNFDRKKQYRVITTIYEEKKKIFVKKSPGDPLAEPFIESFINKEKMIGNLVENKVKINNIVKKDGKSVVYSFLTYPSLANIIEKALILHEVEETNKTVSKLRELLESLPEVYTTLYESKSFIKYFDPEQKYAAVPKESCMPIATMDFNFSNLLIDTKGNIHRIDFEWIEDFPLSKRFILFRAVFDITLRMQKLIQTLASEQFPVITVMQNIYMPLAWYDEMKLDPNEFNRMLHYELHLQDYISLRKLDVQRIMQQTEKNHKVVKSRILHTVEYQIKEQEKNIADLLEKINISETARQKELSKPLPKRILSLLLRSK